MRRFFLSIFHVLSRLPAAVLRGAGALLAAVTGLSWQPPRWALAAGQGLASAGRTARARPKASLLGLLALALVAAGGWLAWNWYQNLPQPHTVAYRWAAPGLTTYEDDGTPRIAPLRIEFGESVAPLQAIGKPVETGIALQPALEGGWHWANDRTLVFTPEQDWAIGTSYRVRMDPRGLLAEGVRLDEYGMAFRTAAFGARIARQALHQDPVDPDLKTVTVHLRFTHPVDEASLRERVRIGLGAGLQYLDPSQPTAPRISLDGHGLLAYVQTAPLAVPLEKASVRVEVARGVRPSADGDGTRKDLAAEVAVPGRYQLGFNEAEVQFADNARGEPEPVLVFESSHPVDDEAIARKVRAWLLPERDEPWTEDEVNQALLDRAEPVDLEHVPGAQPQNRLHAFRFAAPAGRYMYARVAQGVEAVGGYLSRQSRDTLLQMPDYPKVMRFLSEGALLGLDGERRLGFMARGVSGVQVEIARLLPDQLHHLVDQNTGTLARPGMAERYFDRLVERETQQVPFPDGDPARTHYDNIDLGKYLRHDGGRKGVFMVRLSDAEHPQPWTFEHDGTQGDTRLIVVTDLGIIAKRQAAGGYDVFVQSIARGEPVAGARVRVVGRNGLPVATASTDGQGHAAFPDLGGLEREKTPLMVVAETGDDLSFLPVARQDRRLDYSRFDVGGAQGLGDGDRLDAYLFTDRGLYRPGETAHLGMVVRRSDWKRELQGLPVELVVTDPRGAVVMREPFRLSAQGFETRDYAASEAAPAGTYQASLELIGRQRRVLLGSVEFSVREFEADRMKVDLSLSDATAAGWLTPAQVQARVKAMHLFGAPASGRRVSAELALNPAFADFRAYPDYRFRLRDGLQEASREELADVQTGEDGQAEIPLGLDRYSAGAYQLHLLARVFEAGGGRGVAAEQRVLVSSAPWLVGVKVADGLDFVPAGAARSVRWQAVAPDLSPAAVDDLRTRRVEHRHVSVLVKQPDGTYRYESRIKNVPGPAQPLSLPAEGLEQRLDTSEPGEFSLVLEDRKGTPLNEVRYSVAGQGNVSRSLERNAELQLKLDKRSYAPGEEISISVRAPYTGAGLITIERDKVYAHKWFRTDATSSVQTIRLPEGVEGNAYVNVQFVRDPASDEVYMSPLSYGVASFSIDLDARRLPVELEAPERIEPGRTLSMTLRSARPARAVVYAVDEGILQVARYRTPDPLGYLFRKRALEVDTRQILDLILPEFSLLMNAAAPGGDAGADLASYLNPFKRKRKPPVAWWSGLIDLPAGERKLEYAVPDSFNGRLRLVAVLVDDAGIGVAQGQVEVRGPVVITPNLPAFVSPGDRVEVTAGIYSNLEQAGAIRYRLEAGEGLAVADGRGEMHLAPRQEGTARFEVTATDRLGSAELRWIATLPDGREISVGETLSVRPAGTRRVTLQSGRFDSDSRRLAPRRDLHPERREVALGLDASPLVWSEGLGDYLDDYAYTCTEQLVSKAMPAVVLGRDAQQAVDRAARMLRQRQNASGGFGLWASNLQVSTFASLYAADFLADARGRGLSVPGDLLSHADDFLAETANGPSEGMEELRERAYAAYLLARQGVVVGRALADIQERMQNYHKKTWRSDLGAAYLAAAYKLLKQDRVADELFDGVPWSGDAWRRDGAYYDPLVHDAERLTLLLRHFPARAGQVPDNVLDRMGERLSEQRYNSLSAALVLRALDAYGTRAAEGGLSLAASAETAAGRAALAFSGKPPRAEVPPGTTALSMQRQGEGPAYYLLSETGFDRKAGEPIREGLEISRDYLGLDGQPLGELRVGDEFLVRLRMRAVDRDAAARVAVVDLLPGGMEPVVRLPDPSGEPGEDEDDGEASGDADGEAWDAPLGEAAGSDWRPEFADIRDDRVVLYGDLGRDAGTFVYRARATNAGQYAVPAPYAEGIYDTRMQARGAGGSLRVLPAESP